MGRRAKNKQGAPAPLESTDKQYSKKLGKRKAPADEDEVAHPSKKVKDLDGKSSKKSQQAKKPVLSTKKSSKKPQKDDSASSDGWEDVEDTEDLKTHAKYVFCSWEMLNPYKVLDLCSTTAMRRSLLKVALMISSLMKWTSMCT